MEIKKILKIIVFLISAECYASSYDEAFNKAREATFIQIGGQKFVNDLQRYSQNQLNSKLEKLSIRKQVASGLVVYKIIRDKTITFKLKNNSISIGDKNVTIRIPI